MGYGLGPVTSMSHPVLSSKSDVSEHGLRGLPFFTLSNGMQQYMIVRGVMLTLHLLDKKSRHIMLLRVSYTLKRAINLGACCADAFGLNITIPVHKIPPKFHSRNNVCTNEDKTSTKCDAEIWTPYVLLLE